MKSAYTTTELAGAIGRTERAIQIRAKRESWQSRPRAGRGGGYEWLVSSLPYSIRAKLATQTIQASPPQDLPPDPARRTGLDRYRILAEWRAHCECEKRKGVKKAIATAEFVVAYNSGLFLPDISTRIPQISNKSLYRWDKTLRNAGDDWICLCDHRGAWNKNARGLGQISEEAEQAVLACYLTPNRPSMSFAVRAAQTVLKKRGQECVPSDASFRRFLKRYTSNHNDLVVLMREGEKALKDKVGPYILRDDSVIDVGDILVADGHVLNFQVLHPEHGRPHRPTLICWYDWKSRLPVGWEIMPSESTVAISSALRMAIGNIGRYPRAVYLDNGRAFRATYFEQSDAEFEELNGLYARLGIAVQHSRPYEARTKPVERFFGTFNEQCARLIPSYTGRSIDDKPPHMHRNEKWHQARHADWIPTIREAAEIFSSYVTWYAGQAHKGLHGQTPGEVFIAGRGPGVDLAELDAQFLWSRLITPSRMGFTLAGIRYESEALYGLKKPVIAKWSWADLAEIALFEQDGTRIGTAYPVEAIHPLAKLSGDELDYQKVKDANRRQQALTRQTKLLAAELDGATADSGFMALPWMRREKTPLQAVPKSTKKRTPPTLSDERRAELAALAAQPDEPFAPTYELPAYFQHKSEKYEALFDVEVRQRIPLRAEDVAWMREYEQTEEYARICGQRYVQLRELYEQQEAMG